MLCFAIFIDYKDQKYQFFHSSVFSPYLFLGKNINLGTSALENGSTQAYRKGTAGQIMICSKIGFLSFSNFYLVVKIRIILCKIFNIKLTNLNFMPYKVNNSKTRITSYKQRKTSLESTVQIKIGLKLKTTKFTDTVY